jgi:hypothetical protein
MQSSSEGGAAQVDIPADSTAPMEVMATMRLQRVWRSKFRYSLTKGYAVKFLNPRGGITIDYVKSIRFRLFNIFYRPFTVMIYVNYAVLNFLCHSICNHNSDTIFRMFDSQL